MDLGTPKKGKTMNLNRIKIFRGYKERTLKVELENDWMPWENTTDLDEQIDACASGNVLFLDIGDTVYIELNTYCLSGA